MHRKIGSQIRNVYVIILITNQYSIRVYWITENTFECEMHILLDVNVHQEPTTFDVAICKRKKYRADKRNKVTLAKNRRDLHANRTNLPRRKY